MGDKSKKETISDKVKNLIMSDIQKKRFELIGMGSELCKMADKKSEQYESLKRKYDRLETSVKKRISYLDGSYKAQKLIEAAEKAKEKREEVISGPKSKSKKLGERLETLEFKREEKIQQIKELEVRMNRVNLLAEDEVEQNAEEWKIKNELVKQSLSLKAINARIGMTKLRKSTQDAKDIENIKKAIDKYNAEITEYKKKIDKANEDRPKDIVEKFTREHDWILGAVTIDKGKRLKEITAETNEKNNKRREKQQRKYEVTVYAEEAKGNFNLPYREIDENERNELVVYSEKATTFKNLTEFLKAKVARAAGKTVGYAILAGRKIKDISQTAIGKIKAIPQALEEKIEHSSDVIDTEAEGSKPDNKTIKLGRKKDTDKPIDRKPRKPRKEKKAKESIAEPVEEPKTFMEAAKAAMNKQINKANEEKASKEQKALEEQTIQSSATAPSEKSATKVKVVKRVTPSVKEEPKTPVKVTPVKVSQIKERVAVDNNVKKAVVEVGKKQSSNQSKPQAAQSNRHDDFIWGEK